MEKDLQRNIGGSFASSRKLEANPRRHHFQYIHGLASHGVHYIHRPGPTLQDTGFSLLPELGRDKAYISETLFVFIFVSFVLISLQEKLLHSLVPTRWVLNYSSSRIEWERSEKLVNLWTLHPFIFHSKKIYTVHIWCRFWLIWLSVKASVSSHSMQHSFLVQTIITVRLIRLLGWLLAVIQSLLIIASR